MFLYRRNYTVFEHAMELLEYLPFFRFAWLLSGMDSLMVPNVFVEYLDIFFVFVNVTPL